MEIITTNQGKVCTISNVGATPVVPAKNVGDQVAFEGRDWVVTDYEDFTAWFELETVNHDREGTVYLDDEKGVGRLYCLKEKVSSPLLRPQSASVRERIK